MDLSRSFLIFRPVTCPSARLSFEMFLIHLYALASVLLLKLLLPRKHVKCPSLMLSSCWNITHFLRSYSNVISTNHFPWVQSVWPSPELLLLNLYHSYNLLTVDLVGDVHFLFHLLLSFKLPKGEEHAFLFLFFFFLSFLFVPLINNRLIGSIQNLKMLLNRHYIFLS